MTGTPWNAPRQDGEVFCHPAPETWAATARAGLEVSRARTFFGLTPMEVRQEAGWPEGHVVLSAHQPVLFYPGLWVKALAASTLADGLGWTAAHKITDQDAPGEADGWTPKTNPSGLVSHPLKWSRPDIPYAFQGRPETARLRDALDQAASSDLSSVQEGVRYFSTPLEKAWAASSDWVDWHSGCLEALDRSSGTERWVGRASRVWDRPSFQRFMAGWISETSATWSAYNRALDRYRVEQKIQHPLTPVPNLGEESGWWETPFWTAMPDTVRETLWVRSEGEGMLLRSGRVGEVWRWNHRGGWQDLKGAPWRLWPKALVQSLYTRLFLADFFIHGLGGGFYEPVNDLLLKELGEGPAAPFGVASATLWLDPVEASEVRREMERSERIPHWRRVLEKNPEYLLQKHDEWMRELPPHLADECRAAASAPSFDSAVREKVGWLEALKDPARRSEAGGWVREWNAHWVRTFAPLYASLEAFQSGEEGLKARWEVLSFRKYAFFCYPPARFEALKESVDRMIRKG